MSQTPLPFATSDAGPGDGGGGADGGDAGIVLPFRDAGAADAGFDAGAPDAGASDGGAPDGGPDGGAFADAEVVEAPVPSRLLPGEARTVSVTMRNTGSMPWTAPDFALRSASDPADIWGTSTAAIASGVDPAATYRFELAVTAPTVPGRYGFRWQMRWSAASFGAMVDVPIEVTCDDGVFCNGVERFSGGHCLPGPAPCDDGVDCTTDTCDEANRRCTQAPAASNCADCAACAPSCTSAVCGSDGCGGSCGSCADGEACDLGLCKVPSGPGTCAAPFPIVPQGRQTLSGDTSRAFHVETPSCASESTAPEHAYTFTLAEPTVLDARVVGFDTVLSLRTECGRGSSTLVCNDDADPPGWPGSRIARALQPGTYFLLVDGYSRSATGPYSLTVSFTPGTCVPQCNGRYCGSDGCGGSCGTCVTGACGSDGRCIDPCARACEGKVCGSNGCGGSCGTCEVGNICNASGRCVPGTSCDNFRPTCDPACADGEYCGTDCACHPVSAPLPDLVVSRTSLQNTQNIVSEYFRSSSCALVEGCVAAPGWRRLLRFEVRALNIGQVDLDFGPPSARPALYDWSPCHRHFHFRGFAEYELRDQSGRRVVVGRKQAFCLEDIARVVDSPAVSCQAKYTCSRQGIQRGWADVYRASLDCQWLDITDVPPGRYQLVVRVNPLRVIQELTLENNETVADVTIP